MDAGNTRRRGLDAVQTALSARGARSVLAAGDLGGHHIVCSTPSGEWRLRVKTKSAGTWQDDTGNGAPATSDDADQVVWVYVDVAAEDPIFYVAPGWWAVNDIYTSHEEYLKRHGGRRALSPNSSHHAITQSRVSEWRGRWDLLGLSPHPVA